MAQKLTKQEKKFIDIKAETGNGTLAVKEAFGIEDSNRAAVRANYLLRKPNIINAIQAALPDELLAQVHLEGLNATRSFPLGEGEYEDAPDYAVRHKYLDSAYKLKGSYAAEKHVNLNIDAESTERTRELGDRILGLLRRRD